MPDPFLFRIILKLILSQESFNPLNDVAMIIFKIIIFKFMTNSQPY
jgi:hypothetical protein